MVCCKSVFQRRKNIFFSRDPKILMDVKKKKKKMKSRFKTHLRPKQNVFSKISRHTQRTTRKNIFLRSVAREEHYKQVQKNKYNFIKVKKMFFQIHLLCGCYDVIGNGDVV